MGLVNHVEDDPVAAKAEVETRTTTKHTKTIAKTFFFIIHLQKLIFSISSMSWKWFK
jgi:hypothetical protein